MKRRTKILLLLLLALVLGFIFLLPHGGYRRKVEAYKKQLVAQGEKLTMAELAPPPSTNGSKAAKAFMEAMQNFNFSRDMPTMMKTIAPGVAMPGYTNDGPEMTTNYEQNLNKTAELRGILSASTRDFHLDYSSGIDVPVGPVVSLRDPERLAVGTVTQALHVKNFPEAWLDLLAAVDLIRFFEDDPLMISDFIRISLAHLAVSASWMAQHCDHQWSDSQLAYLQSKWQDINFFAQAESVITMERAWGIEALAGARNTNNLGELSLAAAVANATRGSQNAGSGWLGELRDKVKVLYDRYPGFWLWKSTWSYDEELYYLQITTTAKAAAHHMAATGAFVPTYNELIKEGTNLLKPHPNAEKHFLLFQPGYEGVYTKYLLILARTETARRLTVTAIALERYHLQHGMYPASLNELVPAFLPEVPADFMDGKPLRYRLQPDGNFLLYSVGEDGKDDGGDATFAGSVKDWVQARDIVWPRAATPQEVEEFLKRHPTQTNSPIR